MDFPEKINLIMDELGADNVSIARYGGFDRTSLSRFRNGKRVPGASSRTAGMLVEGIYLYADNENSLEKLCSITEGDPRGTSEEIKDSVSTWLYNGMQKVRPAKKAERKSLTLNAFSERLDAVMSIAGISNIQMSRLMNVDSSLISRYRAGVRTPRSNPELSEKLSDVLWHHLQKFQKKEDLAAVMECDAAELDRDSFFSWLCDFDSMQQGSYADVEKLMTAFDMHLSASGIPPVVLGGQSGEFTDERGIYTGTEGLREAVIRFLGNAALSEAKELWLYSDENMDWLTSDPDFRIKWMRLMVSCAKNGIRIRIIHNIDRGFDEMSGAIISWLPLYMTGMIESFYCKKPGGSRFAHSLYICPGYSAIEAFHVSGTEFSGIYHYHTEKELLDILSSEYEKLLSVSSPLISVAPPMSGIKEGDRLVSVRNTLSAVTMSEALADSFGSDGFKAMWRLRRDVFEGCLKDGYVYECVPLAPVETVLSGGVPVQALSDGERLTYSPEQYKAHIRLIIDLLNRFPSYRFYMLEDTPFHNMTIVTGTGFVKVASVLQPEFSIMMTHPALCRAFRDYIDDLRALATIDRHTLREQLSEYLAKLSAEA